jgi:hypothetical protein
MSTEADGVVVGTFELSVGRQTSSRSGCTVNAPGTSTMDKGAGYALCGSQRRHRGRTI